MNAKEEKKVEAPKEAKVEPKVGADGKLPPALRKKRWGGAEHLEGDFVRVTFLVTGGLSGEHFIAGKSGDVPKSVFERLLKPKGMAKLWEKPKPVVKAARPASDKGNFKRR